MLTPSPRLFLSLLFATFALDAQNPRFQWRKQDGGNDHWYSVTTTASNWSAAKNAAQQAGGHLVSINSAPEQAFIERTFITGAGARRYYWIGLTDEVNQNQFKWLSGEPNGYANWHQGEPSGIGCGPFYGGGCGNEDYVVMNWHYAFGTQGAQLGTWNDVHPDNFGHLAFGIVETESIDVTFKRLDGNDLESHGGGVRFFSERLTPNEQLSDKVKVVATTGPSAKDRTVYFWAYDVDDPSSDPDIDISNAGDDNFGEIAATGANLQCSMHIDGTAGNGKAGEMIRCSETVQVSENVGTATATFRLTRRPGDNFRVVASFDPNYYKLIAVRDQDLVHREDGTPVLSVSPILTIWRTLHVEVDRMGPVSGNSVAATIHQQVNQYNSITLIVKAASGQFGTNQFENGSLIVDGGPRFPIKANRADVVIVTTAGFYPNLRGKTVRLVDDDALSLTRGCYPIFCQDLTGDEGFQISLAYAEATKRRTQDGSDNPATNVFAPAFVRIKYDLNNPSPIAPFVLNSPPRSPGPKEEELSKSVRKLFTHFDNRVLFDRDEWDDYWVAYRLIAYQGVSEGDADPQTEDAQRGRSDAIPRQPRSGMGSAIFAEPVRESIPNTLGNEGSVLDNEARLAANIAAHELGHLLGGEHEQLGLMTSADGRDDLTSIGFSGKTIRAIRESVRKKD